MSDFTSTAILTEHLGFPPISLIDDVINAVNDIMYKCTQAMEQYLQERTRKNGTKTKKEDEEIQLGTAKLETLLENEVSKNFDKFELYTLRNILHIPEDLVSQGWFRLQHHTGLQFDLARRDNAKLDQQIDFLMKDIELELQLRKTLKLQIARAQKVVAILKEYRKVLQFLKLPSDGDAAGALKLVSPLSENLYYVLLQAHDLFSSVEEIMAKLATSSEDKYEPTIREKYINGKSIKLLESIGVLEAEDEEETPIGGPRHILEHEVATAKEINEMT